MDHHVVPPQLRRKCLVALWQVCTRNALLPRSLQLQIQPHYNPSAAPLHCGGFGDMWMGKYLGWVVAVKVRGVYSTTDPGVITSMSHCTNLSKIHANVLIMIV